MRWNITPTITMDTIIALIALAVSIFDLWIHSHRESVRLHIRQNGSPAYSFSFMMYQRYTCVFFNVTIENFSLAPITISRFELRGPDGLKFPAQAFAFHDALNHNGFTFVNRGDTSKGTLFNLGSENILNHMRFEPNDKISGFLVFFDVPVIESGSQSYTLHTYAGRKHYRTKLTASKFPDDLKTLHGV